jgi:ferric-dicitrate binding protein FerR (iron transport regulator)
VAAPHRDNLNAMKDLSRPGKPRPKDQGPRAYRVYRPPDRRRRAGTMVVVARVVVVAVLLALAVAMAAQI